MEGVFSFSLLLLLCIVGVELRTQLDFFVSFGVSGAELMRSKSAEEVFAPVLGVEAVLLCASLAR